MEKHKCKLCFKSFANGRALGGHMRSHMLHLYVAPKPPPPISPPSSSSEKEDHENQEDYDGYELSENPKKSTEFSFPGVVTVANTSTAAGGGVGGGGGGSSVVLQDRESETETSKNVTVRRRSKRIRRKDTSWFGNQRHFDEFDGNRIQNQLGYLKKSKIVNLSTKTAESSTPEPVSSISDTSPEEDVAYCLMMLSRDKWSNEEEDREHEETSESDREITKVKRTPARMKYRCETCNKVFRSYQALGGHRASHKKIKQTHHYNNHQTQNVTIEDKIHECPVCFKVFSSGQALGGHKRSHLTVTASSASMAAASMATDKQVVKQINLIDLNLPAPVDDEEDDVISQIEVSVVSDGEFVKTH